MTKVLSIEMSTTMFLYFDSANYTKLHLKIEQRFILISFFFESFYLFCAYNKNNDLNLYLNKAPLAHRATFFRF